MYHIFALDNKQKVVCGTSSDQLYVTWFIGRRHRVTKLLACSSRTEESPVLDSQKNSTEISPNSDEAAGSWSDPFEVELWKHPRARYWRKNIPSFLWWSPRCSKAIFFWNQQPMEWETMWCLRRFQRYEQFMVTLQKHFNEGNQTGTTRSHEYILNHLRTVLKPEEVPSYCHCWNTLGLFSLLDRRRVLCVMNTLMTQQGPVYVHSFKKLPFIRCTRAVSQRPLNMPIINILSSTAE